MSPNTPEELAAMRAQARMIERFMCEAVEKLEYPAQRCSSDSEESLFHEIGLLMHMADTYVWSPASSGDREREPELHKLQFEHRVASRWYHQLYAKFRPAIAV